MSSNWGLALDAEIAYRHEQLLSDFFRPWRRSPRRTGADTLVTGPRSTSPSLGLTTPLRAIEPTGQVVGGRASDRQRAAEGQQVCAA
jgi:hypothetical protein